MRKSVFGVLFLVILWALPLSSRQQTRGKKTAPPAKPVVTVPVSEKKYPSLLWEISGNGLKKPSYLFGTMHVSDKLAFHLGDSFYHAIKSADIVALETNPESWQDDFSRSAFYRGRSQGAGNGPSRNTRRWAVPYDYMRITTFAIDGYEEAVKASLVVEPSMINGMLYRTYGTQLDDFEEDTFLDMYIFQVGKKLGKRLCGVEDFDESEKLVVEAYRDMIRDENKKRRSYDYEGMMTNPKKIEDAYRKGDLDMLDSLESLTVYSEAFQEKFLYKRNEIQANSIDTIIQRSTLFVGVGAAHLPGQRGVIEMLRRKGYTLRPVQMDDRNSLQKEAIEKTRTSNAFVTQTSNDGFYKVDIPGKKFYRFTDWSGMDVVQYADMINGAYYMVTRIKTNSLSWGHSNETVLRKVDSLLYENIPGKILKKTPITKDGYPGLDISNRTRRGDNQRYQVFVTPFEVLVFKMSGNGDYITLGTEAEKFFGSIHFQPWQSAEWVSWQPATGGFTVQLPHAPSLLRDNNYGTDRLEYAARDVKDGNSYLVMKVNLHNYSFIEADSFELNLMDESYGYSSFIDKQLSRKFTKVNGYPALESKFRHKDGSYSIVKYIIQGPVYYAVIAQYRKEDPNVRRFMESFSITPFVYTAAKKRVDSLLHIVVNSPVYPDMEKKESSVDELEELLRGAEQDDIDDRKSSFASRLIGNDTIGEKILVTYTHMPEYSWQKDTGRLWSYQFGDPQPSDSIFIYKVDKETTLPGGARCREIQLTDTGSSRLLVCRMYYKNGNFFSVTALTDTISKRSVFLDSFFSSFVLADSLEGQSFLTRKTTRFFKDLFSKDSATAARARKTVYQVELDSLDMPLLKSAIESLNWNMQDYLSIKQYFIEQLGEIGDSTATAYLQQLYWKIKDTSDLQHAILNALLSQRTRASFLAFKDLIIQEPPIIDEESGRYNRSAYRVVFTPRLFASPNRNRYNRNFRYPGPGHELYDTLSLTKAIFPGFLQLLNVDDYRDEVMDLLVKMVDSGYLKASDYEGYFSKIYLDGKQLLKKQIAKENKDKMEKAGRTDKRSIGSVLVGDDDEDDDLDAGNGDLDKYAVLLLPFRDKNPGVQAFFEQLMQTSDRRLLYNSFILLLRNHQPVPDSLFRKYAALDSYRSELYEDLQTNDLLSKFPAKYKNQKDITRSMLVSSSGRYEKIDTLVYLDKLPVQYENKKGLVYFYKYKRMRDDVEWQIVSVGMQPEKADDVDMENDDFTNTRDDHKLDNSKPVKEQLQKLLKEMLYARHNSAAYFYEARSYSMYKSYMSEMVKNRRYKD